jgi:glycine/D-amino acid oxidase-like deaminating enzyme
LTTLAIIGGGIAGRSLIYALAKRKKAYSKIVIFDSDLFAKTCSLRSTAIVAPRGVSEGHSELGDLILSGFKTFVAHVEEDRPQGVFPIVQFSGTSKMTDQFTKRYPGLKHSSEFSCFSLHQETYIAQDQAYLIDTKLYLNWLKHQTASLPLTWRDDFIVASEALDEGVRLKNQTGEEFLFDQVVFAGGARNRFWNQPKVGRPIQGSYFEFRSFDLGEESFSLTLDGDNLIYQAHQKLVLIGSTTKDLTHDLADQKELAHIYQRLSQKLKLHLPSIDSGIIITGLREKASKRKPYLFQEGRSFYLGGLYKNGFSLSLYLGQELAEKL